jgi:ribosomal-protein-alanine N-acetyltransferase
MFDVMVNCEIRTRRLHLRPYRETDINQLFKIAKDPEVTRYLPDKKLSFQQVKNLILWSMECNRQNQTGRNLKLNLTIVHDNQPIGWCGLGPSDIDPALTEVYYAVDPCYWGHGFGQEAIRALLHHGFEELGVTKVTATVVPENIASVRILQNVGMRYIQTIQETTVAGDPYFIGQHYYELEK